MIYPSNQIQFEMNFTTEKQCLDYVSQLRWPEGFVCPKCSSKDYWHIGERLIKCKKCLYKASPTAGTIFHDSKKPLVIWSRAIWWIVAQKNGVSAMGLQKILGLGSYRTAWTWLHKFRRLMVVPGREKLSGEVEVDETYVGGEKEGKRGRGAAGKSLVVIAVEIKDKATGRIRLSRINNATEKQLVDFIESNVEKAATIITDGWKSYTTIKTKGYNHIVTDSVQYDKEEMLPNAHRVAALLKRWLLGTHQNFVSHDKLEYYLDEYTFRYNRRKSKSRGLLFYRIMEQSVLHEPVTNKRIFNCQ